MKPLGSNIVLETIKKEESISGIILPDTVDKEQKDVGIIISIGKLVQEVKPGDKVVFKKWNAEVVDFEKKVYTIINESDILAILE